MKTLINKNILLAVTGSIAAYKAPDVIRRLQDLGAEVKVILTTGGERFITKLSLQVISKNPVFTNLWAEEQDMDFNHIDLVRWADLVLVAPASANTISSLALGRSDDLLTTAILASDVPLVIAPAMNQQMFNAQATTDNLNILRDRDVIIIEDNGVQACGEVGMGRFADTQDIVAVINSQFKNTQLTAKKVIITLGATIEDIDPVRFISNRSSGKMGVALAQSCIEAGAEVILVCGNVSVDLPNKCHKIHIRSASDMYKVVIDNIKGTDVFIGCAAVADYRIKDINLHKIKKQTDELNLTFIKNKDIISEVAKNYPEIFIVGFAAESENLLENAKKKLINKNLNMLIANQINQKDIGCETDDNEVSILSKKETITIAKNSKKNIAKKIIEIIAKY